VAQEFHDIVWSQTNGAASTRFDARSRAWRAMRKPHVAVRSAICRAVTSQAEALHNDSRDTDIPHAHRALWEKWQMNRFRSIFALLAIAATLAFVVVEADARPRTSFGSRGTKTFSAPPPTATAPNAAAPINRSITQPGAPGMNTPAARAPNAQQPGGFFGRGLFGGLAAGLLGAGLIGMLMGHGFLGGLAGLASILGFLLQIALIGGVAFLLFRWWQRRSQPQQAYAGGMPRQMNEPQPSQRSALGGFGGFGAAAAPASEPLEIGPDDFNTFERLLGEIQTAYGREDIAALRSRVTPEMLSYYAEELNENASRVVVNEITDVKLLQGDLSEAWREDGKDYATVAMRYTLVDKYVDRNTGRAAEGNEAPQEATEVWTFMRVAGGNWVLSAIQQA
jgi:predicted lipid-binding transport protein (Tim44 family)